MAQTDQMKTFLDYLEEAEKKTKTKDQSTDTDWSGLDDLFKPKADQPLARINDDPKDQDDELPADDGDRRKKASQRDTLRAAGNIEPNQRMRDLLGRMRDIEADDDEGYPDDEPEVLPDVRVDTENLPAIAGRALQAAGTQDPKFHKVANLPGNMSRAIRTLGKQLFRSFTSTDTDDIWMVGNLNGQGPNSRAEVNAVANWARTNGEDIGAGDIDFDTSIPGYTADIQQYSAAGIRWLVVRDEFGDYIYSWPERDSIQHANRAEIGQDRARLARD
jgi:hypothetical protein